MTDLTNWQIFGIIVLVLVFLFVLFKAIKIVYEYMRNYKDDN